MINVLEHDDDQSYEYDGNSEVLQARAFMFMAAQCAHAGTQNCFNPRLVALTSLIIIIINNTS